MTNSPGSAESDRIGAEAGKAVLILAAVGAGCVLVLAGIVKAACWVAGLVRKGKSK